MNHTEFHHVSILLSECLDALEIKPDGVYIDATLGGAGHSLRIAERLGEGGRLICIDRDDAALAKCRNKACAGAQPRDARKERFPPLG